MEKRLNLISHEPLQETTAKSTCRLDAVLENQSYPSAATN